MSRFRRVPDIMLLALSHKCPNNNTHTSDNWKGGLAAGAKPINPAPHPCGAASSVGLADLGQRSLSKIYLGGPPLPPYLPGFVSFFEPFLGVLGPLGAQELILSIFVWFLIDFYRNLIDFLEDFSMIFGWFFDHYAMNFNELPHFSFIVVDFECQNPHNNDVVWF
mgnify:CR=1 FL=1